MRYIKDFVKPVIQVPYSLNIVGVAVTMDLHKTHCVIVENHNGSLGIITEKDIVRDVVARCRDPLHIRAWEVMKQPVIMVDAETPLTDAVDIMKSHSIRNLIVTEGGQIIGVVKRTAILNHIKLQKDETEEYLLKQL